MRWNLEYDIFANKNNILHDDTNSRVLSIKPQARFPQTFSLKLLTNQVFVLSMFKHQIWFRNQCGRNNIPLECESTLRGEVQGVTSTHNTEHRLLHVSQWRADTHFRGHSVILVNCRILQSDFKILDLFDFLKNENKISDASVARWPIIMKRSHTENVKRYCCCFCCECQCAHFVHIILIL